MKPGNIQHPTSNIEHPMPAVRAINAVNRLFEENKQAKSAL
jgi:hypothetical protein